MQIIIIYVLNESRALRGLGYELENAQRCISDIPIARHTVIHFIYTLEITSPD